jgi:hypothetical protein
LPSELTERADGVKPCGAKLDRRAPRLRILGDAHEHPMIAAGREGVEIRELLPLRIGSFRPDLAAAAADRDSVTSAWYKERGPLTQKRSDV